jgi:hypothetical protein
MVGGRCSCARYSRISRDPRRTVDAVRIVWCPERRLQRNRHRVVSCALVLATGLRLAQQAAPV